MSHKLVTDWPASSKPRTSHDHGILNGFSAVREPWPADDDWEEEEEEDWSEESWEDSSEDDDDAWDEPDDDEDWDEPGEDRPESDPDGDWG